MTRDIQGSYKVLEVNSIADLRLLGTSERDNITAKVLGYYAPGDGGGGPNRFFATGDIPGTYVDNGGSVIVPTGGDGSDAWLSPSSAIVEIKWFGAKGDGVTLDNTAVNNAFAVSKTIHASNPEVAFLVSNIQFPDDGKLICENRETDKFIGDGVNPLFLLGDGTGNLRKNQILHANIFNDGARCITIDFAPNWEIRDCVILSINLAADNAINTTVSFRAKLLDNMVSCNGGGWAFQAMDNVNGLEVIGNTITGGVSGGAVNIGQSQNVNIKANIIESSSKGIYVASTTDTGNGLCSAINITGNYLEQVTNPFVVGTEFIIRGGRLSGNYLGNTLTTVVAPRDAAIKFGRLQSYSIKNNALNLHTTENVFEMVVDFVDGQIEDNEIEKNRIQGTPANVYIISGTYGANASVLRAVGAANYFDFMSSELASHDYEEYISPVVTANVAVFPAVSYISADKITIGGRIISVDVIEATGTLTGCFVRIGITSSTAQTVDQDISLLSYSDGYASVPLLIATPTLNAAENNTFRITAGTGTGTFRVRIRYRGI